MPIVNNPQAVVDYESIILSTDLRAQIKLMLTQNSYSSVGDFLNAVQNWLHNQDKHLTDGYVYNHIIDVLNDGSIQLISWEHESRTIRCYMSNDSIVKLSYDYPELPAYLKAVGIPVVEYGNGRFMYFEEVYPEHLALLEAYGAQFENKIEG